MTRFNTFTIITTPFTATLLTASMLVSLTGCHNHDKPVVAPPVRVTVEVAGMASSGSVDSRSFTGTVDASDASTVSFSVPGTINAINVKVGQKVAKGQVIASVKSGDLINASNIAQAELSQARDAYARLKKLHEANALPDIKWVEVQQKLKQAENAADIASRAVSDATLRSPISGYVSEKLAEEGQTVLAAEPIVKIVDLKALKVAVSVPEEEIGAFSPSTNAIITFDALDSLKLEGKLVQKGVTADPLTRSYTVKFEIPGSDARILPGMIANVDVTGFTNKGVSPSSAVSLPAQAVQLASDNRRFVWIVKNGRAERRFVTADELTAGARVTVSRGLTPGDSVIVEGMQKVSTATEVTPVN